ncbi:MAG: LapA family protein, partial [Leptolyngbyaceae cyanobacterium SL_5_9]|nr:LapA family protein [Leptolyngbyaceae cyanobacterium SL_5_9]NJO76926.1 LapA family protein [Leptolyngbyaceae cyanobacterium RM1_406_9]
SMALVLLLTFALGVVFGLLVSVPPMIGRMRKIAQLKRKVDEQAYDLEAADRKLTEATTQLTALQAVPNPSQIRENPSDLPSATLD